jgi:hypothetical protein
MTAPIRFLAYGRKSYRERGRRGVWDEIPPEALSDVENLRRASPAYGFGALAAGSFLIWQELAEGDRSFGYPDVLLLDLGGLPFEAPWDGCTAGFLHQLFADDRDGRRILAGIEGITIDQIVEIAQAAILPPEENHQDPAAVESLCVLLLSSCLSPDPLAVAPSAVGLSSLPSPELLHTAQACLPIAVRNGLGWAVNVRDRHAAALGVRLVLHNDSASDPECLEDIICRGRTALRALNALPTLPGRELIAPDLDVPLWSDSARCAGILRRLIVLEKVSRGDLSGLRGELEFLPPGEERTRWDQFFLHRVLKADPITSEDARFCFQLADAQRISLAPQVVELLDASTGTLLPFLRESGRSPLELPASLPLPEREHDRAIQDYAAREQSVENLLKAADKEEREHRKNMLLGNALRIVISSGQPLSRLHKYGFLLAPQLLEEARRRLETRPPGWIDDYIAYGNDPDLAYLTKFCENPPETADDVVDALLNAGNTDWVEKVGATPIRHLLSISAKSRIIDAYRHHPAWAPLAVLHDLYFAHKDSWLGDPPSKTEREALFRDLHQLLDQASKPFSGPVPRLSGIYKFLGELPEDLEARLRALEPLPKDPPEARLWLDGWRHLDPPVCDAEAERILCAWAYSGSPQYLEYSAFSSTASAGKFLFRWLSLTVPEVQESSLIEMVKCLLRQWPRFEEFSAVTAAFPSQWDTAQESVLVRRIERLGLEGDSLVAKSPSKMKIAVQNRQLRQAVLAARPGNIESLRRMLTSNSEGLDAILADFERGPASTQAGWVDQITAGPSADVMDVLIEYGGRSVAERVASLVGRNQPDRLLHLLEQQDALKTISRLAQTSTPAIRWMAIQLLAVTEKDPLFERLSSLKGGGLLKKFFGG